MTEIKVTTNTRKCYVTFLWGFEPEYFGTQPKTYVFNTKREREWFIRGVMEVDGYNGYSFIEHDKPKKFEPKDFPNFEDYNNKGG